MTDDIKAIRDALAAGPTPTEWEAHRYKVWASDGPAMPLAETFSLADAAYIAAVHPERIARLLDALDAAQKDAERWRWLVRHASLGFDAAPSWNAVVRLPVLDADDQHIAAIVDRAMKEPHDRIN